MFKFIRNNIGSMRLVCLGVDITLLSFVLYEIIKMLSDVFVSFVMLWNIIGTLALVLFAVGFVYFLLGTMACVFGF
ncbi:MAG: hypothetical protein UIM53_02785 [Acutalibacteraceae bacterium]|nr:hypothetical protein [Acutalibacteraceae bacterium]